MTTRFIEWNYETMKWTEYKRLGECNGCGDCCKYLIKYQVAGARQPQGMPGRMGDSLMAKGIWSEYQEDDIRRFARIVDIDLKKGERCTLLQIDNTCLIHQLKTLSLDGGGALCLAFPVIPRHIKKFKNCSYSFEKIATGDIPEEERRDYEM